MESQSINGKSETAGRNLWTPLWRAVVFALAATSIACLLTEFYGFCPMRQFTLLIFGPSLAVLGVITASDAWRGDRRLYRAVMVGVIAGFVATISYDIFRLPFVFAKQWHIDSVVPAMNLYKVFPGFGAMILGQPTNQPSYSLAAHLIGWVYHFSNGITFGIMYVAMIGNLARRNWSWAIVMAAGLELAMLFTPYTSVFGIPLTARFVVVTLTAHIIFGIAMGLTTLWLGKRGAPASLVAV
jgi:hypothetical protein